MPIQKIYPKKKKSGNIKFVTQVALIEDFFFATSFNFNIKTKKDFWLMSNLEDESADSGKQLIQRNFNKTQPNYELF